MSECFQHKRKRRKENNSTTAQQGTQHVEAECTMYIACT